MKGGLEVVRWIDFPHAVDERGTLTAVEGGESIPFEIRRIFYMHGTPAGVDRGGHAHRGTHQVVIPISGQFEVELSDGRETRPYTLSDPNRGLYMPPMTFVQLRNFSPHAVCLVLADTPYDRSKSIRTWEEFLSAVRGEPDA
jgi:dTDP-4-dehydrorhamnose 3,5-epimerase-like enzyme